MSTKKNEVSFEENIKELEQILKQLEGGEVSLEEMLTLFEEGVRRTKECSAQLKSAEQKIMILTKNSDGNIEENNFETE